MKTIVYTGAHTATDIAATGQIATRGMPLEVDDVIATSLLKQDTWSEVAPARLPTKRGGNA